MKPGFQFLQLSFNIHVAGVIDLIISLGQLNIYLKYSFHVYMSIHTYTHIHT